MIAHLRGILTFADMHSAVIDIMGLGYRLSIPVNLLSKLPHIGSEVTLHTSFVVREQSHALYGFETAEDRDLFETVMGVTGFGPKSALNVIGHMTKEHFHELVRDANIALLCKIPGVGKKGAERLVLELKDKLPLSLQEVSKIANPSSFQNDALRALLNLGISQALAAKAIKKSLEEAPHLSDLGDVVSMALKKL